MGWMVWAPSMNYVVWLFQWTVFWVIRGLRRCGVSMDSILWAISVDRGINGVLVDSLVWSFFSGSDGWGVSVYWMILGVSMD